MNAVREASTITRSPALPGYAVVTPVRDEVADLPRTVAAISAQTHRPQRWVLVDDGSTDGSRELAHRCADQHDWVDAVDAGPAHERSRGAAIVRAFEAGRAALPEQPEIIVKLDADLFLPPHYFEWVAATFARDASAGIVGGVAYVHDGWRWSPDGSPYNVNGVAKAYRSACLEDIGGLRPTMGWDGIDEYGARARGWTVQVLSELQILHYRRRGSRQPWYRARWEEGLGNHYMGYHPLWLMLRAGYRMVVERPPLLGGLVLTAGYVYGGARSLPRCDDPRAIAELRREQRDRLSGRARRRAAGAAPAAGEGPAFWATPPAAAARPTELADGG